jgi:ketosteroid isomerase-like protein
MKTLNSKLLALCLLTATVAVMSLAYLRNVEAASSNSVAARLQRLEDREQILELLVAYGATLDRHDFAAFGQLFAEDAVYVSGPTPTHGRAAIQAQLEKIITSNPSNLPPPNAHLLFNPSIQINGDHATALSSGAYVAPDRSTKTTQMVFFVWYQDTLIRQQGRWWFEKRVVKSGAAPNTLTSEK